MGNAFAKAPAAAWVQWQYRLPGDSDTAWIDYACDTSDELEDALRHVKEEPVYSLTKNAEFRGDQVRFLKLSPL